MPRAKIYNIGDTVEHETFGIGTVVDKYRNNNNTPIVVVKFNSEEKPLSINARFWNMRKIK